MTSFKEIENVKFEFEDIITYGVKKGKFGGYSISVVPDDETIIKINGLAEKHNTKNPFYGKTLYLKSKNLAEIQKKELLNKGKAHIMINFTAKGTYSKDNIAYLVFEVTKLRKINVPESNDECPEV